MSLINDTIDWYKGEVFEAFFICGFGVFIFVIAIVIKGFGDTYGSQALILPIMVIGIILGMTGGYNAYVNKQKIMPLEQVQSIDEMSFIQSEKERVEGFQYLYTFTKYLATVLFALAILIFFFLENKNWQAIAIAMVILGLSGLVIDYFSKERADTYYQIILYHIN